MGNAEQLRTIVDNLLSNAVKYSPTGGEIRLSLRKDGGHMELEIEDDGPGVDPDERGRVFEPFFQGRAARALGVKGTGFGLAIVAECVANHHGKVEVLESHDDDAGARIRVQIPVQSFG
jgi:two-component system sensor histidine kinase GlrK